MKKALIVLFFIFSIKSFTQQSSYFWDNVQYGGGFTLNFGSQTTIGISPSAIYNFENGFSAGAGLGYLYSSFDESKINVYSGSLIGLYQTPLNIILSSEFEYYFASQTNGFDTITTNFPALHLGVAYRQGRFAIGVRYDVLYDENKSVFASPISPIIRFYF